MRGKKLLKQNLRLHLAIFYNKMMKPNYKGITISRSGNQTYYSQKQYERCVSQKVDAVVPVNHLLNSNKSEKEKQKRKLKVTKLMVVFLIRGSVVPNTLLNKLEHLQAGEQVENEETAKVGEITKEIGQDLKFVCCHLCLQC